MKESRERMQREWREIERNPKNEAEFEMQEKPNKRPIVQQGKTETASATSLIWFILSTK